MDDFALRFRAGIFLSASTPAMALCFRGLAAGSRAPIALIYSVVLFLARGILGCGLQLPSTNFDDLVSQRFCGEIDFLL